jgi:hypothetical protein
MELEIRDKKTVAELQKDFSREFPFLKMEFYAAVHKNASAKLQVLAEQKQISECSTLHREGSISIGKEQTVKQVEQDMWDRFGLSVQIFRKSGNIWIQTTLSNSWSLERQNNEALEINKDYKT